MDSMWVEMILECPHCGASHNYEVEFNSNSGLKSKNSYSDWTKFERVGCDMCGSEFKVMANLKIELEFE